MNARVLCLAAATVLSGRWASAQAVAPALPTLGEVRAALAENAPPKVLHVWLQLRQEDKQTVRLEDPFLGIRVTGDTRDNETYRFSGRVDAGSFSARVRPDIFDRGAYHVEGSDIRAVLKRIPGWQKDYSFSGSVRTEGGLQRFDLVLKENLDHRAFFVDAPGVDLKIALRSGREITGTVDPAKFGKQALTALSAAVSLLPFRPGD